MTTLSAYDVVMTGPFLTRLLLDAQGEFLRAADAVPVEACDRVIPGLNTPGWVVAHAGFYHDVWINVDAQGKPIDECDPWPREWVRRQDAAGHDPIEADFGEARAALDRVVKRATPFLRSVTEASLNEVPAYEEGAFPPGTTQGYLISRDIAHLFAHASELNVISTLAGGTDIGLPGRLPHTSGRDS